MSLLFLILGAALILWGADRLTDGASALARRLGMTELVVGLTVVAFGTSLPEFVTSFTAALQGCSDISIGNVVGSNLFNTLVIVGASACVAPIAVNAGTISKDIPFALLASLALGVLCLDGVFNGGSADSLSQGDGLILLLFFAVFMAYTFSIARGASPADGDAPVPPMPVGRMVLNILAGLIGLVVGGHLFVEGAVDVALALGVSEAVVGLTLVAGGTSLPELATSVMAARKGCSGMAIGNVIGSNLFNVFFVLGLCSSIRPMSADGLSMVDLAMLVLSVGLLWAFAFSRHIVQRWEGGVLLVVYALYLTFLIYTL